VKDATLYLIHIKGVHRPDYEVYPRREGSVSCRRDDTGCCPPKPPDSRRIHASGLDEGLKANHPEIDWRGISGFRNILVHQYLSVNPLRVWNVIEQYLPLLAGTVARMLEEIGDE